MKPLIALIPLGALCAACARMAPGPTLPAPTPREGNPIVKNMFTADPAALVHDGVVYIYTGHDEAPRKRADYVMNDWHVFSSSDMANWKDNGACLKVGDFAWAKDSAWASQTIELDGKFYWYVAIEHATIRGKAIGVAVGDSPIGPFKDTRGSALITNDMTTETKIGWDDIDPTVFIDDDGQAYLYWGNTTLKRAKLKKNMIELDGNYEIVKAPAFKAAPFTEAPWLHKRGEWYYLSYATGFPEKTAYAMSRSIDGPWEFAGVLNELAGNSNTNHQAIIDFKGHSYFVYHTGALAADAGSYHRSVCVDELFYNADGTMKRVVMTTEGVRPD